MKLNKNGVIAFLIAMTLCLVFLLHHADTKLSEAREKATELEQTISNVGKQPLVTTITLHDTVLVKEASSKVLSVTKNNLQSSHGELLSASKVKASDVGTLSDVGITTVVRDTVVCLVDSFGGINANYADGFVNIDVNVTPDRVAAIDYVAKDSLTIINYQKKHSLLFGLIKWTSHEGCKVITHNPKSTPTALVSYQNIDK